MSQEGSEGWETASESTNQGDQENAGSGTSQDASAPGTVPETALSFSKKSSEEVEQDAATIKSRSSSISSQLGRSSISGLTSLPPRSPAQQAQISASPERLSHDPQHDRTRPPTPPVLEPHDQNSSTQKRGPGVPRNPVSDTWRDEAYTKRDSGKDKMVDVAAQLDRWRCEYCGRLNNRGVADDASEAKIKGINENKLVGVPGPSRPSPQATAVQIPGSIPPGIAPGEVVKCRYCGEQMFLELTRYDPREEVEDGVRWDAVDDPDQAKALRREVLRGTALNRVRERWREDEKRHQEEERQKSTEADKKDESGEGKEDEANTMDQDDYDEWEDEN